MSIQLLLVQNGRWQKNVSLWLAETVQLILKYAITQFLLSSPRCKCLLWKNINVSCDRKKQSLCYCNIDCREFWPITGCSGHLENNSWIAISPDSLFSAPNRESGSPRLELTRTGYGRDPFSMVMVMALFIHTNMKPETATSTTIFCRFSKQTLELFLYKLD